jgi:hypothetical protein
MKYGKIIAGILAILGAIIAFIFGKRSGVLDNGGRASAIGGELDEVTKRANSIERNASIARDNNRKISESIDRAIGANDDNIGIIQKIRARGIDKKVDPTD